MHYACAAGSISCVVALLNKGCDLREANNEGCIPLDHIPESKQGNLGKLLRKAGGLKLLLLYICFFIFQQMIPEQFDQKISKAPLHRCTSK